MGTLKVSFAKSDWWYDGGTVYKTDENGNTVYDESGQPVAASEDYQAGGLVGPGWGPKTFTAAITWEADGENDPAPDKIKVAVDADDEATLGEVVGGGGSWTVSCTYKNYGGPATLSITAEADTTVWDVKPVYMAFNETGGAVIFYTVDNPPGTVSASCAASWITLDGMKATVAETSASAPKRSAAVIFTCEDGSARSASIVQEGVGEKTWTETADYTKYKFDSYTIKTPVGEIGWGVNQSITVTYTFRQTTETWRKTFTCTGTPAADGKLSVKKELASDVFVSSVSEIKTRSETVLITRNLTGSKKGYSVANGNLTVWQEARTYTGGSGSSGSGSGSSGSGSGSSTVVGKKKKNETEDDTADSGDGGGSSGGGGSTGGETGEGGTNGGDAFNCSPAWFNRTLAACSGSVSFSGTNPTAVFVYTSDLISANLAGKWSVPAATEDTGHTIVWENSTGAQCGCSVLQSDAFTESSESEGSESSESESTEDSGGSSGSGETVETPEQDSTPRFAIFPRLLSFTQEGGTETVALFREPTKFALTVDESDVPSYENADGETGVYPEIFIGEDSISVSAPENTGYDYEGTFYFYAASVSATRYLKIFVAGALGAKPESSEGSESEGSESEGSESEGSESEGTEAPAITPAASRLAVFCNGASISIAVESNVSALAVASDSDWLTATIADGVLSIGVAVNLTDEKRAGTVVLSDSVSGVSASVKITQHSRYYDMKEIPLYNSAREELFGMAGTMFNHK